MVLPSPIVHCRASLHQLDDDLYKLSLNAAARLIYSN